MEVSACEKNLVCEVWEAFQECVGYKDQSKVDKEKTVLSVKTFCIKLQIIQFPSKCYFAW